MLFQLGHGNVFSPNFLSIYSKNGDCIVLRNLLVAYADDATSISSNRRPLLSESLHRDLVKSGNWYVFLGVEKNTGKTESVIISSLADLEF